MPMRGERLSAAEVATLKRWIDEGAVWPATAATATVASTGAITAFEDRPLTDEERSYWAFKLPVQAPLPIVARKDLTNPIDLFLEQARASRGVVAAPRAQGKFRIAEGSVSNIDLVAVMQSDAAGSRAGVTKFAELTGEYVGAEHRAAYRNVSLQGGVLRGNGSWEIGQSSALNGRAVLEIRSQVAQDRGTVRLR